MKSFLWLINLFLIFIILGCATGGTSTIPLRNKVLDILDGFLSHPYET